MRRSKIASIGRCCACQEELVCSDIDRADTHKLAKSMADTHNLAKSMVDFKEFEVMKIFFFLSFMSYLTRILLNSDYFQIKHQAMAGAKL